MNDTRHLHRYLSKSYLNARRRIQTLARSKNWSHQSLPYPAYGPEQQALSIDLFHLNQRTAKRRLILSSGVHGVEGYLGSAIQLALIDQWDRLAQNQAWNITLVHAVNPYGFAWNRRVNEENVDLNRAHHHDASKYFGAPPNYELLKKVLAPKWSKNKRLDPFVFQALWLIFKNGFSTIKQQIAGGQYVDPQGLFYGGSQASRSQHILAPIIHTWCEGMDEVLHIDIHTGLGPYGQCSLTPAPILTKDERSLLSQRLHVTTLHNDDPDGVFYEVCGDWLSWCSTIYPKTHYLGVTAEFGTYHPIKVLMSLRQENALTQGEASAELIAKARHELHSIFCPQDPFWSHSCIEYTLSLIQKLLH